METDIDFLGYGEDCRVEGRLRLENERLTDLLNREDPIRVRDVTVVNLRSGDALAFPELDVFRNELTAVVAIGPRGDPERRVRTKPEAVEISLNGYQARGFVHSPPAGDGFLAFERRPPMIPITSASIVFRVGNERVTERYETIIINRDLSRFVRRSTALAQPEVG